MIRLTIPGMARIVSSNAGFRSDPVAGAARKKQLARSSRHMPSTDGEILSDVWESPDDRSRFSQDCAEPGGRGRVLSRRIAGLSCRWQEICLAGFASTGLRKPDAYARAAGGLCGRGARDFPADSRRLGKNGTHPYSHGGSE